MDINKLFQDFETVLELAPEIELSLNTWSMRRAACELRPRAQRQRLPKLFFPPGRNLTAKNFEQH
jgi:hypothetical protein